MLRKPMNDEGCDVECKYCGRQLLTGRCACCGYVRECDGCSSKAVEFHWNNGPVFLCVECTKQAYEQQMDDARAP